MIQLRTIITPADNSGAKKIRVIHIYGGTRHRYASLAGEVLGVVISATSNGMVKKKEKVRLVIVRTKKEIRRPDGSHIRFDDNAAVIVDNQKNPRATRIFGPIAREVKDNGFNKIASMAKEVV